MIVWFNESIQWTGDNEDEVVEWATKLLSEWVKKSNVTTPINDLMPYFAYDSVFPNNDGMGYSPGTWLVWNDFNELDYFIPIPNDLVTNQ